MTTLVQPTLRSVMNYMDELLIYLMLHQLKSQESQQMLKLHQKGY